MLFKKGFHFRVSSLLRIQYAQIEAQVTVSLVSLWHRIFNLQGFKIKTFRLARSRAVGYECDPRLDKQDHQAILLRHPGSAQKVQARLRSIFDLSLIFACSEETTPSEFKLCAVYSPLGTESMCYSKRDLMLAFTLRIIPFSKCFSSALCTCLPINADFAQQQRRKGKPCQER